MTSITNNLQNLTPRDLGSTQETLSRSLARLAASATQADPSSGVGGLAGSDVFGAQSSGLQSASADVQTALSSAQTAGGYLGGMSALLTRMQELAGRAKGDANNPSALAQDQKDFSALQDQLRATIGGTTSEIGGANDVNSPAGSFKGAALFGPGPDGTNNPTNLRQGAMLDVIGQDSAGNYNLSVSDADATADVAGALQQVTAGRSSVAATQSSLALSVANLQVEQQNLISAFSPIIDPDTAQQSNQFAIGSIFGQSADALGSQGNQTPATVFNLLQG
jgi:flagellin